MVNSIQNQVKTVNVSNNWRLACKADPLWGSYWRVKWTHRSKFLILEAFDLQFRGEGCLRWTITDVYGVLIATG